MSDTISKNDQGFLDRHFKLKAKGTNVRTEIIAGITTFVAMAYIIFVNPSILKEAGIPVEAAVAATIWSAALCTIAMGLFANLPVAMAPGMGLNAFFTFYVCKTVGLNWETALGAVFVSGLVFFVLTVTKLRQMIIDAVPMSLKSATVVGIGMFIAFVGLQSSNLIVESPATKITLGTFSDPKVDLALLGVLIIGALLALKIRAAMLIGIVTVTVIGMIFGVTKAPEGISDVVCFSFPGMGETFLKMDLVGAFHYGLISIIFTFTIVELFDNIGTLIGVTKAAGLVDKDGKIENCDRALMTDSVGTLLSATAPALIVVGAMMMKNVQGIDFTDFSESIPAFLTVIMMPMTYSIGNGFGFGFASYCLLKLITGKYRQVTPVMWGVSIILIIGFFMHQ